jgi:glycolate oxidase iron-sulfur subunit
MAERAGSFGLPEGFRFIGPEPGATPRWLLPDAPDPADIASCVACGLCLPHCPTYRLTGEESASPRGRIAAMRAVSEGRAEVDGRFMEFMDLCLSCRACEDVCPSHVPFGRMMEHARSQVDHLRPARHRFLRWLGLEVALPRGWLLTLATALLPVVRPLLPRRTRGLLPRVRARELARRLPRVTEPAARPWVTGPTAGPRVTGPAAGAAAGAPGLAAVAPGTLGAGASRGTVAVLAGCVQDRWYRPVNRATIRVLARNGWRVVVPPGQTCCGALGAHYGRLGSARRLARRNLAAFAGVDWIVVNAAGCGAHMKEYGELLAGDAAAGAAAELSSKLRDFMEFLDEQGIEPPAGTPLPKVALHDPCHLLHAQGISVAPRAVLGRLPGLGLAEVGHGDRCCGAAGLYNVLEPEMADRLKREKAAAIQATGAPAVLVANPGCAMQIAAGLGDLGSRTRVLHPAELLDQAYTLE